MRYKPEGSRQRGHPDSATDTLARGLGVFSIALGLVELLAAKRLSRALGMWGSHNLIRAYGAREIATGAGILAAKDPTPWIWGRLAGDAIDAATLAPGLHPGNPRRGNVAAALAFAGGATALDVYCAQALSRSSPVPLAPLRDYSDRSGFPRPPEAMRGAARDFVAPRDFRTPEPLQPFTQTERDRAPSGEPVQSGSSAAVVRG
jgi:hypothetical protein